MAIKDALLAEFDHELATTRRCLERAPEDKFSFKPHEKSWSLQQLVSHLANLASWMSFTLQQDSLDVAPPGEQPFKTPQLSSRAEVLKTFDENARQSRAVLEKFSDADFMKPWSLLRTGKAVFTLPKVAVARSFVLNHIIHHRGQLSVYLRLTGAQVPSIYGPSADESAFN